MDNLYMIMDYQCFITILKIFFNLKIFINMFTLCQLIITNNGKHKFSNRMFQIGVKCYRMILKHPSNQSVCDGLYIKLLLSYNIGSYILTYMSKNKLAYFIFF